MNNSWIEETLELIREMENDYSVISFRITALEEQRDELVKEQHELDERMIAAQVLIQAYKEKHNIKIIPSQFLDNSLVNKSYPQILIDMAREGGGYLSVIDTVDYLLHSGFSSDKRSIQSNVYSALRRLVENNRFKKIRPGEYRFLNGIVKDNKPSGLRQVVKGLKSEHPEMTRKDVYKYLINNRFDFKGKKPTSALNITWAYLGYSKEGRQQKLLNE